MLIYALRESFVRPRGRGLLKIRDSCASVEKLLVSHRVFSVSFCPVGGQDIRRKVKGAQAWGGVCASFWHAAFDSEASSNRVERGCGGTCASRFQVFVRPLGGTLRCDVRTKKVFFQPNGFSSGWDWIAVWLKTSKKWRRIVNKCIRSVVKVNLLAHKISFSFSMKKTDGLHFVTCRPFPCNRRARWLPLVSSVRHVYLSGRFGLRFRNNSVTLCHENHD